ncbi:hypothetical protein AwDysgo_14990 [Bacteroidales bacterium]|nr:hypothetical protein AwDysgo_14990 [Bacteroidales bacterium]
MILTPFYEKYNNHRLHASVCYLPPNIFLECWNKGLVEQKRDEVKRIIKSKSRNNKEYKLGLQPIKPYWNANKKW